MMMVQAKLDQLALNKLKIKELEEANAEIIAELGLRSLERGTHTFGKISVEVSRNARFNTKLATELFPLGDNDENIELYKVEVDSTLAKKHLSPADYERCQTEFPNNKVEVKVIQ